MASRMPLVVIAGPNAGGKDTMAPRVLQGGHPSGVHTWQMFDNSAVAGPRLLAAGGGGQPAQILDAGAWEDLFRSQR